MKPTVMTDQIAFLLGEFNFPCFYSTVTVEDVDSFELSHFFQWTSSWPNLNYKWFGLLKSELISTPSQKLAYIRGKIKTSKKTNKAGQITITYANSSDFVALIQKYLEEVMHHYFPHVGYIVMCHSLSDTFPRANIVTFESSDKAVEFIRGA